MLASGRRELDDIKAEWEDGEEEVVCNGHKILAQSCSPLHARVLSQRAVSSPETDGLHTFTPTLFGQCVAMSLTDAGALLLLDLQSEYSKSPYQNIPTGGGNSKKRER